MGLQRLDNTTLGDRASAALLEHIRSQDLKPGAALPSEAKLTELLGVSLSKVQQSQADKKRRKADEGQMSPAVMSNGSWGKDPYGRFPLRFFNGQYWTNQVADGDVISTDEPGWR